MFVCISPAFLWKMGIGNTHKKFWAMFQHFMSNAQQPAFSFVVCTYKNSVEAILYRFCFVETGWKRCGLGHGRLTYLQGSPSLSIANDGTAFVVFTAVLHLWKHRILCRMHEWKFHVLGLCGITCDTHSSKTGCFVTVGVLVRSTDFCSVWKCHLLVSWLGYSGNYAANEF